ncbi:hypothetical protein AUP68_11003 [Ilyonectria robusta]
MEDYVQLNEEYKILMCRHCCISIRPGISIERHFRQEYQLKGPVLREIIDYFQSMELNDPVHATLPEDGSAPVALLKVRHGFSCTQCRYLTVARDNITRHGREARDKHGQSARGGCSGAVERRGNRQYTDVQLQSWQQGGRARYWIINDGNANAEGSTFTQEAAANPGRGESAMQRMIAKYVETFSKDDAGRLRKGDIEEGLDRDSPWVKRLRWLAEEETPSQREERRRPEKTLAGCFCEDG